MDEEGRKKKRELNKKSVREKSSFWMSLVEEEHGNIIIDCLLEIISGGPL